MLPQIRCPRLFSIDPQMSCILSTAFFHWWAEVCYHFRSVQLPGRFWELGWSFGIPTLLGCSSNVLKHAWLCVALDISAWMRTHQLTDHSALLPAVWNVPPLWTGAVWNTVAQWMHGFHQNILTQRKTNELWKEESKQGNLDRLICSSLTWQGGAACSVSLFIKSWALIRPAAGRVLTVLPWSRQGDFASTGAWQSWQLHTPQLCGVQHHKPQAKRSGKAGRGLVWSKHRSKTKPSSCAAHPRGFCCSSSRKLWFLWAGSGKPSSKEQSGRRSLFPGRNGCALLHGVGLQCNTWCLINRSNFSDAACTALAAAQGKLAEMAWV